MINGTPSDFSDTDDDEMERAEDKEVPDAKDGLASNLSESDQVALFHTIDSTIRIERLYADITLQRQDVCERFDIRRHALNDLLSAYAGGCSFTQYINAIRMEEAVKLLRDCPDMTLTAIAATVGFTPANLREKFKRQFGMTPGEYRQNI